MTLIDLYVCVKSMHATIVNKCGDISITLAMRFWHWLFVSKVDISNMDSVVARNTSVHTCVCQDVVSCMYTHATVQGEEEV